MRIAVTYDKGSIFQHFGHAEQFGNSDEIKTQRENSADVVGF